VTAPWPQHDQVKATKGVVSSVTAKAPGDDHIMVTTWPPRG
jgi:predicted S18 family serine protease